MNGNWLFSPEFFTAIAATALVASATLQIVKNFLKFDGTKAILLSIPICFLYSVPQIPEYGALAYAVFSVVLALNLNGIFQVGKQLFRSK